MMHPLHDVMHGIVFDISRCWWYSYTCTCTYICNVGQKNISFPCCVLNTTIDPRENLNVKIGSLCVEKPTIEMRGLHREKSLGLLQTSWEKPGRQNPFRLRSGLETNHLKMREISAPEMQDNLCRSQNFSCSTIRQLGWVEGRRWKSGWV